MSWLFFAIASLILWGFWGVLGKMGCRTTEPNHYLPLILIGELIVAGIATIIFLRPSHFRIDSTDNLLVIASSIAYALGGLFYFLALSKGNMIVVVVLTAAYPIITVALAALVLHEPMTLAKIIGVIAVSIGVALLSL